MKKKGNIFVNELFRVHNVHRILMVFDKIILVLLNECSMNSAHIIAPNVLTYSQHIVYRLETSIDRSS